MPPTQTVRQNGLALRAFRQMRGLSVDDLAKRADMSPQALRNYELENKALTLVRAERLCTVLGVILGAIVRDRIIATYGPDETEATVEIDDAGMKAAS